MAYKVTYQRRALANLESIEAWIAQDSPRAATRVIRRIHERISDLSQFSEQGRLGVKRDTRELVITGTPYIVTYALRRGGVFIITIRHGARRPLG